MEKEVLYKLIALGEQFHEDMSHMDKIRTVHKWMDENIVIVSQSQSVIKTNFTSEEEDVLKYFLAGKLSEELMEEAVKVDIEPNKVSTKIVAFKRK